MEDLLLAVTVSRSQLNTCSELSKIGAHEEARAAAVEVQLCITSSLLPEAQKFAAAGDKRAVGLVTEVRVLQCASLLAQAFDAEEPSAQATSSSDSVLGRQRLIAEAKEIAESFLPANHPMVALARSLCPSDERSFSASLESGTVSLPSLAQKSPKAGRKGPNSPSRSAVSPSSQQTIFPALPEAEAPAVPKLEPLATEAAVPRAASPAPSQGGSSARVEIDPKNAQIVPWKEKQTLQPLKNGLLQPIRPGSPSESAHGDEHDDDQHTPRVPRNIFAEYIADYQLEKDMHKAWFNNRQDDMRKHVFEQARFVRLQNLGKDINELADPKFTSYGHKLTAKVLHSNNQTRSDSMLLHRVQQAGVASPEAFMTSQLRIKLDPRAKPMVQPRRRRAAVAMNAFQ